MNWDRNLNPKSEIRNPKWHFALNVLTAAAALAGALAIAFEYGYWTPPLPVHFLHAVQIGSALAFILEMLAQPFFRSRLATQDKNAAAGRRWPEWILLLLLLIALGLQWRRAGWNGLATGSDFWLSYRPLLVFYIVAQILLRAVRLARTLAHGVTHPVRLLLAGYLTCILLGAFALDLPRAVPPGSPIMFVDALFTSTSAMTLTGLTVRATGTDQVEGTPARLLNEDLAPAEFSRLGQTIILVLIQLGGLNIMILGTTLAFWRHPAARRRIVRFVVLGTFGIEAVGAAVFYTMVADFGWPTGDKAFFAIFHSASAFCNAGFSLLPDSLVRYHGYWQIHGVLLPLLVLGGLGWPVLINLWDCLRDRLRLRSPAASHSKIRSEGSPKSEIDAAQLTLHSRLALWTSAILLLGGAAALLLLESPLTGRGRRQVGQQQPTPSAIEMAAEKSAETDPHQLRRERTGQALADALFTSAVARTAGLRTIDTEYRANALGDGSLFVLVLLMLIGGSPGSAAGGLKTVTLAVLALTATSCVRGKSITAEGAKGAKGIGDLGVMVVKLAVTLAVGYLALVSLVTLALLVTESGANAPFLQLWFEAASACGSVGLGTGLTADLTMAGRVVVMLAMVAGRLGPLALLFTLAVRPSLSGDRVQAETPSAEEFVALG